MRKFKHLLNAGTMAGSLAFATFLMLYLGFSLNPFGIASWITVVLPPIFMYLGIKKYKEEEGEGFLTYGQGFTAGIVFSFVYASLSGMLILLYGSIIDSGFLDLAKEENLRALGESKDVTIELLGREFYEQLIAEVENTTVGQLAFSDFQSKLIGSAIVALAVAGILLKRPPVMNQE